MSRDLRELLASVDLEALADHLVGARRGHGHGARWPSPVPDHPQTGKSPPMSIFTDRTGTQRWSCWATGTSGTAIDLVATALHLDVAGAIDWLAAQTGQGWAPSHRPRPPSRLSPQAEPSPELIEYVEACARLLDTSAAASARRWLTDRRHLSPAVLRANRVGFDPGPANLARSRGLPYRGPGVVLPTFDPAGRLVYAQVRYLDPEQAGRKYDNPSAAHAAKPTLSWPRASGTATPTTRATLVCEGTIDGLTAATAGVRVVALLAAGDARRNVTALAALDGPLVLAVDNDSAGDDARNTLSMRLAEAGRTDVAHLILPGDLNDLAARHPSRFRNALGAAMRGALAPLRRSTGAGAGR